jgi:hypothetical protein
MSTAFPKSAVASSNQHPATPQAGPVGDHRTAGMQVVAAESLGLRKARVERPQGRLLLVRRHSSGVGVEGGRLGPPHLHRGVETVTATAARSTMLRECRLPGEDTQTK